MPAIPIQLSVLNLCDGEEVRGRNSSFAHLHDLHRTITHVQGEATKDALDELPNSTLDEPLDSSLFFKKYSRLLKGEEFKHLAPTIFCHQTDICLDVVDIECNKITGTRVNTERIQSNEELATRLRAKPGVRTRIISICSSNSINPLSISHSGFEELVKHDIISPYACDLFSVFGSKPSQSEAGGGRAVFRSLDSFHTELQYLITYPEPPKYPGADLWHKATIRQTGLYHLQHHNHNYSLFLLLHPRPNSRFQHHLAQLTSSQKDLKEMSQNSFLVHFVLLLCYLDNWRWYINALNKEFEKLSDMALTFEIDRRVSPQHSTGKLLDLRHLADVVFPIPVRLEAIIDTIDALISVSRDCKTASAPPALMRQELHAYRTRLQGYIASARVLSKRISGVTASLDVSIERQNQKLAMEANYNMLDLTQHTVGDSSTVRVVTLVTMIYLPPSFVATLLGTNLFNFDSSENGRFRISPQFWIFVAISVPLTMITVGVWLLINRRRCRGQRFHLKMP